MDDWGKKLNRDLAVIGATLAGLLLAAGAAAATAVDWLIHRHSEDGR